MSVLKKLKMNFSFNNRRKTNKTHNLNFKNIKNYIKINGLEDKIKIKVNVPHKKLISFLRIKACLFYHLIMNLHQFQF